MKKYILPGFLVLLSMPVVAHPGGHHAMGFGAGIVHPLSGLDHALLLVAAGAWLALQKHNTALAAAAMMLSALVLGILCGILLGGFNLEPAIMATLLVVAAALALARRESLLLVASILTAAGLIHGWVHGAELNSAGAHFGVGLVLGSALILSLSTLGFGLIQRYLRAHWVRLAGVSAALVGLFISI